MSARVRHGRILSVTQDGTILDKASLIGWRVWDLPRSGPVEWRTPNPGTTVLPFPTWDRLTVEGGDLIVVSGGDLWAAPDGFTQAADGAYYRVADGTRDDVVSGTSARPVFTAVLRNVTTSGLVAAVANAGVGRSGPYDQLDWRTTQVHTSPADIGAIQMLFCGCYASAGTGVVDPGDHAWASAPYLDGDGTEGSLWGTTAYQNPATPSMFAVSGATFAVDWVTTVPKTGPKVLPVFYTSSQSVTVHGFYWRVRTFGALKVTVDLDGVPIPVSVLAGAEGAIGDIATIVQDGRRMVVVASRAP